MPITTMATTTVTPSIRRTVIFMDYKEQHGQYLFMIGGIARTRRPGILLMLIR